MRLAALLLLVASCATNTAAFLESQKGHEVTSGYVIRLRDLVSPKVRKLADGVAYTVTQPGCTVVLELGNRQRRDQIIERVNRRRHADAGQEAMLPPHDVDRREDQERPPDHQAPGWNL